MAQSDKKGAYGLTVLPSIKALNATTNFDVDIVAVHGLNGGSVTSWSTEECFWLRDLLPQTCPSARIMTFGYNANVVAHTAPGKISMFADDLLVELLSHREQHPLRPIIFICHSMGGLVVKQCLIRARLRDSFRFVGQSTTAIVFLGTPHCGSDLAEYARIANRISAAVRLVSSNQSSKELRVFSDTIQEINTNFVDIAKKLQLVSFFEKREVPKIGKVVEDWSMRLNHPSEQLPIGLDADHMSMIRYNSAEDPNYQRVSRQIARLIQLAAEMKPAHFPEEDYDNLYTNKMSALTVSGDRVLSRSDSRIRFQNLPSFTASFYGRNQLLSDIKSFFALESDHDIQSLALHGLGGVGKTQIALKFAKSMVRQYSATFWIHADSEPKMARDFDDIAKRLGLTAQGASSQLQSRDALLEWLSNENISWLMVFDNVESLASLKPYWPLGKGSVLLTARTPEVSNALVQKAIHVEPFTEEDGAQYLLSRLSDPSVHDESRALSISQKLGGLPIALSHMASYIEATACTLEQFLGLYAYKADPVIIQHDSTGLCFDYERSFATVWQVAFDSISDDASELLEVVALLDADNIPEYLFQAIPEPFNDTQLPPPRYQQAIGQLRRHALIEKDLRRGTLSVHRMVQETTMRNWTPKHFQAIFEKTSACISKEFPRQVRGVSMFKDWEKCWVIAPHLLSLARHYRYAKPALARSLSFAELLAHCGWYLYERGQRDAASEILNTAKMTCDELLEGKVHLTAALVYNNLSAVYSMQNKFEECAKLSYLVITIREKILKPDDEDLASAYANYGADLNALDRLDDANKYYEKALRIRSLPQNADSSPELLGQTLSNAARCWGRIGKFPEAEAALKKAIELRTKALGLENPSTAISLYGLGNICLAQGRLDEAIYHHSSCLQIRRGLSATSYWTGISCHKMATLRWKRKERAIAEKLMREAISIFNNSQSESGLLARSTFKLSQMLEEIGEWTGDSAKSDEARKLYKEAIATAQGKLPETPTEYDIDGLVQFDHR